MIKNHEKALNIKVKLTRSLIGSTDRQRRVVKSLGLKKIGQVKTHKDNNCIRGMVNKVNHLLSYVLEG